MDAKLREPWVGIDIGTTYTRACVWDPETDQIIAVKNAEGSPNFISVVAFDDDGNIIFGQDALYHSKRVRDVRQLIGANNLDESVSQLQR